MKANFPIELIMPTWLLAPERDDLILNSCEPALDGLLRRLGLNPECQTLVLPMPAHVISL
jgi:hypothetical protein